MLKRSFDLIASTLGIIVLAPFLLTIAALIKIDSPGPIFFTQTRVGRYGKLFRIHKFRTMHASMSGTGLQITVASDHRVTRAGYWLRKYKLDELPQLLDVWLGSMSLVGPRPEVPLYVDYYPHHLRDVVLSIRPGITDLASIYFKDENLILGSSADPHKTYLDEILPVKLELSRQYVETRSFLGDIRLILKTLTSLIR